FPNGTRFSVGTGLSDAEREDPPPVGSIITFRYQELSEGGVPRFPPYLGVRFDSPREEQTLGKAKALKTAAPRPPPPPPAPAPAPPAPPPRRAGFDHRRTGDRVGPAAL